MSDTLATFLIVHVLAGVIGVFLFGAVALELLKNKPSLRLLRWFSLFGFLLFAGVLWPSAGYYYVTYYGKAVKPIIKAGSTPWIHTVIMETKEHIFLFLPFAALAITLLLYFLGDKIEQDQNMRRTAFTLTSIIFILGVIITLMGILISGAAK
jgi:hypothetical protein